jgi:hypothetical protein
LLLVYVVLRLMLASSGDTPSTRLAAQLDLRQRADMGQRALQPRHDLVQATAPIGHDPETEWARRSMVVTFFQENIGGDRFWQLVDDMLRVPHETWGSAPCNRVMISCRRRRPSGMTRKRPSNPAARQRRRGMGAAIDGRHLLPGEYRRRPFLAAGR